LASAIAAALAVALGSFALYRATLLPGVDFGDSGSIQTVAGSALVTPRDGYPLYFAIGDLVLRLTGDPPALAMNVTSAVEGALACGAFVLVAVEITGLLTAAVAGAILFAVSYTFWSQCVTAEVYALHMLLVLATIHLLLRWERQPTTARLAAVFACYAFAFGNHLSMILLAPGIVAFLFLSAPQGWRGLFAPRVVTLACGLALLGAAQYLWNLHTLWALPDPPPSIAAALQRFWFDATKSDWRDTMVLSVPQSMVADHMAMYWFDLRQQFGIPAIGLAGIGVAKLLLTQPRRGALLLAFYLANVVFAFSYNVGDAHVFYLPSHLMVALAAASGVAAMGRLAGRGRERPVQLAAGFLLAAYAVARGYHDFPALDRSRDERAGQWLGALTAGLDEQRQVFLVDLNWQAANGLSYFTKVVAPQVVVARMRDVLLYVPALILDNQTAARDVIVNPQAGRLLSEAYGPLFETTIDRSEPSLGDSVRTVPAGTRYVMCLLKPTGEHVVDADELHAVVRMLTGGTDVPLPLDEYSAVAGLVGDPPVLVASAARPFARTVDLNGVPVEIRMDSWLAADTIRRMGFGHVIARRQHTLIVERGISFAAFGTDGIPVVQAYDANLFAKQPRYLVRTASNPSFADVLR
jgi:hypothetical protein